MQAQNRPVSRRTRPIPLAVAFVIALFAIVFFTSGQHVARTSPPSVHLAVLSTPNNQAPDAQERNDLYSQALAAKYRNQSPDAQERNQQLAGR